MSLSHSPHKPNILLPPPELNIYLFIVPIKTLLTKRERDFIFDTDFFFILCTSLLKILGPNTDLFYKVVFILQSNIEHLLYTHQVKQCEKHKDGSDVDNFSIILRVWELRREVGLG